MTVGSGGMIESGEEEREGRAQGDEWVGSGRRCIWNMFFIKYKTRMSIIHNQQAADFILAEHNDVRTLFKGCTAILLFSFVISKLSTYCYESMISDSVCKVMWATDQTFGLQNGHLAA